MEQDMHNTAWDLVGTFCKNNLEIFPGKSQDAESTVLPALTGWVHDTLTDIPETLLNNSVDFS